MTRLTEIGQAVSVPGFRLGKVPMALLKQRYSESVRGEILERTIEETTQNAMTERELRPAMQPKIEIVTFEEGKDLEYKLEVELLPDIEPMEFSTLSLERLVADEVRYEFGKAGIYELHVEIEEAGGEFHIPVIDPGTDEENEDRGEGGGHGHGD